VIAGKLLAAKRPHLVPIYDQYVARALRPSPEEYWSSWQEAVRDEEVIAALVVLRASLRQAGYGESQDLLSDLRLLDIVVWMAEYGSLSDR
jgi:hypothetical protein